jgi:hypothetical protein
MENIVEYLPNYAIALLIELFVFFGFVYLVSIKTEGDISRRWKAAAFIGVFYGLLIHLVFLVIIVLGWIFETNFETFFINLPERILSFTAQIIALETMVTMPIIIIGVFMAYHHLWQTGDRFVEKYWKNPKIHYGENQKPPFLKF